MKQVEFQIHKTDSFLYQRHYITREELERIYRYPYREGTYVRNNIVQAQAVLMEMKCYDPRYCQITHSAIDPMSFRETFDVKMDICICTARVPHIGEHDIRHSGFAVSVYKNDAPGFDKYTNHIYLRDNDLNIFAVDGTKVQMVEDGLKYFNAYLCTALRDVVSDNMDKELFEKIIKGIVTKKQEIFTEADFKV